MGLNADNITVLLDSVRAGDDNANDQLMSLVYDRLRVLAHNQLRRERQDHTLNTTALVHEAYLQLAKDQQMKPEDRSHFFALSAKIMRNILVSYARKRNAEKRGGGEKAVTYNDMLIGEDDQSAGLLALDEALEILSQNNERLAKVVEFKFFGGMKVNEIAQALSVSDKTVKRDWVKARAWLHQQLKNSA